MNFWNFMISTEDDDYLEWRDRTKAKFRKYSDKELEDKIYCFELKYTMFKQEDFSIPTSLFIKVFVSIIVCIFPIIFGMHINYVKDYHLTISIMRKCSILVFIAIGLVSIIDRSRTIYRNKKMIYYEKTLEILKEILENRNKVLTY